ncbi:MAG: NAD(+) synthase, partial [Flavobacteriales bacterium]|nr:NAD(+) synthase [Flavobacteriales bacterium]
KGLVMGIKDYFGKLNLKSAIIGLSGGVDSALVAVLLVDALGKENVTCVMLPSIYSSEGSITDSQELLNNLGCHSFTLPIKDIVDSVSKTLTNVFAGQKEDVTEENIQARSRSLLLMAMANKFVHVLINTSNKSESAVGYSTLYGDMSGGLSVIGDLYKTEVFELCKHINKEKELIPDIIITKPPSAELRPDQKDSDSLPKYDILDGILYQYIEKRQSPKEIISQGFDSGTVNAIIKLVNRNEHKRYQSPPVLRISNKGFGIGRRMPIVGKYME